MRVPHAINPIRGEIWFADLDPVRGHEQGGPRPVLVITRDSYNRGPSGLIVVLPLTTTHRGVPIHVPILPPEGGISRPSVILCDAVSPATLAAVESHLRSLLVL
jgi:mRNA interferase MazF